MAAQAIGFGEFAEDFPRLGAVHIAATKMNRCGLFARIEVIPDLNVRLTRGQSGNNDARIGATVVRGTNFKARIVNSGQNRVDETSTVNRRPSRQPHKLEAMAQAACLVSPDDVNGRIRIARKDAVGLGRTRASKRSVESHGPAGDP